MASQTGQASQSSQEPQVSSHITSQTETRITGCQEEIVGNASLQEAINSLIIEKEIEKLMGHAKICMENLTTFSIFEVDKELLQWIMPVIKESSQKIYDDNSLLSDTAGEDFVIDILKGNFYMAIDFLTILKTIFEYLLTNDEIDINDVPSVTTIPAQVILSTFEHCRNSSQTYKKTFNNELLQVFNIAQQVHNLFLELFDSHIILENDPKNTDGMAILSEVLDIICDISNSLSDLNFKSLIATWKAYATITQKFSGVLMDHIDIRKPMLCLKTDILKNLTLVSDLDSKETKIHIIKKTGLLIKVTLKILDMFWNSVEKISEELLILCCIIFSFPTEYYNNQVHLLDITTLIDDIIYGAITPFVDKLVEEKKIIFMPITNDDLLDEHSFGLLHFLNACLKSLAMKQSSIDVNLPDIVRTIFVCTKLCFNEFAVLKNTFASIVVNISACLILQQCQYERIEIILLENVLQENLWGALLAMDIWSLILKYSTEQSSKQIFANLLQKYQELNFGTNTYRLENIYLKCLIQRIFKILPNSVRCQLAQTFGHNDWKVIGFDKIPMSQKNSVEQICSWTVKEGQKIGSNECTMTNFVTIMENLKLLSTLDTHSNDINVRNLVEMVGMFWEFDNTDLRNGVFKYFANNLCKITRKLITEFSNKQLFKILNRLKTLSCEDSYKFYVYDVLSELCNKNANEFGQDGHKIFALVSSIFNTSLVADSNNLIRHSVLEIMEDCSKNGKDQIVRDLARTSIKTREDISNYLQKRTTASASDKAYFIILGNLGYSHNCVQWKTDEPSLKKIKLEKDFSGSILGKFKEKKLLVEESSPKAVQTVDNVQEAIINIKSEVKCLMNILKTEKMTAKNVADLKIISNQLLSFI